MDHLPPPSAPICDTEQDDTQSSVLTSSHRSLRGELLKVSQIAQIRQLENNILVKALIHKYLTKTPYYSTSTYCFEELEWNRLRLLHGANEAIQFLPTGLCDRVDALSYQLQRNVQLKDAKNRSKSEILFSRAEEPDPASWDGIK